MLIDTIGMKSTKFGKYLAIVLDRLPWLVSSIFAKVIFKMSSFTP